MSVKWTPPYTPLLYWKTGVYRDIHYFLIFALKHRLYPQSMFWAKIRKISHFFYSREILLYIARTFIYNKSLPGQEVRLLLFRYTYLIYVYDWRFVSQTLQKQLICFARHICRTRCLSWLWNTYGILMYLPCNAMYDCTTPKILRKFVIIKIWYFCIHGVEN